MGKGKRNREQRKRAVDASEALDRLLAVETQEQFLELIDSAPEVLGDGVRKQLSEMASASYGAVFDRWLRLLTRASQDAGAAWTEHEQQFASDEKTGRELGKIVEEIQEAESNREPTRVIQLAEPAVAKALEAELTPMAQMLEAMRANAFLTRPEGSRQDNIDKAVSGFGRALSWTVVPEEAARLHMYIGIAMAERIRGDPAENIDAGINALREALHILPSDGSPDLRATIQSNLATSLLRRQRGEKVENLKEALDLCGKALEYRTLDRNPNEWAVVQLNYAPTLQQLARHGEADPGEAESAFREVIAAEELLDDEKVANAHYQLGRMLRINAEFDAERFAERWDPDAEDGAAREKEEAETQRVLNDSRKHLEAAVDRYDSEHYPAPAGRAFAELSYVLKRLGRPEEATTAAEAGLRLLPLTTDPRESAQVGGTLGDLLAQEEDWERSAAAFRAAAEAAEFAFYSRLDADQRESEAKSTLNLTRWAAFSVAAAGDAVEALRILESGRSRDLRQRLGLGQNASAELAQLPEELRLRYVDATSRLAQSPLGAEGAAANRMLQEVLRDIREIRGFEDFATRPNEFDLLGALEPNWPILYVNPTPYGTLLLLLEHAGDGAATASAHFLDEPTSLDVLMRLLAGEGAALPEFVEGAEHGSFLVGASGFGGDLSRNIQKDVEHVLPWLGKAISSRIHEVLIESGARGVTLVPCGPIALAPLHAAPWMDGDGMRYLVDNFEIRHAPSATFAAASLARANERDSAKASLVALVDPENNLSAAQAEFSELSKLFDGPVSHAASAEATWTYLKEHAQNAQYLHLACHARSGVWGESLPAVILADGPVDVTRLTELAELPSRLVTVSACQSAVVDITHMPEEAVSVGTVLVASGAACVIASLWPVRSDTTALLMTRLYEEMVDDRKRPPEALGSAQLWLRDLTDQELDVYLSERPSLKAEFQRRAALGDRAGVRSPDPGRRSGGPPVERPFSGPDYWAPFIAIGA